MNAISTGVIVESGVVEAVEDCGELLRPRAWAVETCFPQCSFEKADTALCLGAGTLLVRGYSLQGYVEFSKTGIKSFFKFTAMVHRDTARYIGGMDVTEDVSSGCLRRQILAWEGADLAGCPVHDDEDLVVPAGTIGKVC